MPPQANPRLQAVLQALASHPELDRQAVLSVFGQEGLSGGIGDGGHAFGPAQLNDAGGVLTGKLPGASVGQKQAWAWSPQGLQYALAGISKVAAGRRGPDAVNAIVSGFERPANPQREIAGALSAYGGQSSALSGADGGSAAPAVSSSTAGAGADQRQVFARALLGGGRLDSHAVLNALLAARQAVPETAATTGMATSPAGTGDTRALASAAFHVQSGVTLQHEDPRLVNSVNQLATYLAQRGKTLTATSGDRTQQPAQGFAGHLAPEGHSLHERYKTTGQPNEAIDLTVNGTPIAQAVPAAILRKFGLWNSVPGDLVHTNRLGVRG